MSASYGFALSSAAVLGIVLFAERLAGAFERAMPHGIAEMMAMTVAAQLFTLPIQVLMEPELPLLSVPANLLVSPFVGLATMAGLMAWPAHGASHGWPAYSRGYRHGARW